MAEISIITFNRGINKDVLFSVPSYLEHWGIYVEFEGYKQSPMLYHADKTSVINNSTLFKHKSWSWLNGNGKKVSYLVLVGHSSTLTHEEMMDICSDLSKNRGFNTISNNCQEWVKSVLYELVRTGHLSHLCLEELKENNEIVPLLGW